MAERQESEEGQLERLREVVRRLRAQDGCPWDRAQTHESLKPTVIEEAAEVIGGIDILAETGDARNLCEELGDLLFAVILQAQIAEEEGLFTLEDVAGAAAEKMIRRHPHVFGTLPEGELPDWEAIKAQEKAGREWERDYLPQAFLESGELLQRAMERKGLGKNKGQSGTAAGK